MVSHASAVIPPVTSCPSFITANSDVQNHVMAFLSTPDLSSLMKTCRHFLDACLLSLCAHSRVVLYEDDFRRVLSFRSFLRIDAGPLSRAHLIRDIWVALCEIEFITECDPVKMLRVSEEWTPALLDILRHCHNVRRLRLDRWFMEELPFALLFDTISSSMHHLEELTICAPYGDEVGVLHGLARLPLQRITFLRDHGSDNSLDPTPLSLEGLSCSLTEIDADLRAPINTPFPLVRKLGVRETRFPIETFVADAMAAFPNVVELILRGDKLDRPRIFAPGMIDGVRALRKKQWRSLSREAWPSLSTIWAEDLCTLYCLGISKPVSSVSIPFGGFNEAQYITPILADTCPDFLELRVSMEDPFRTFTTDWGAHFGPPVSSVGRLTMLYHTVRDHSVKWWNGNLERDMLDDLSNMLPAFTGLAYLRIKFAPKYTPLRFESFDGSDICAIRNAIRKRSIALLIQASPKSLRWVGLEVYDLGLECWEVSHASEGEAAQGGLVDTNTSSSVGWAVLKREGMDVFEDVRPSLDIAPVEVIVGVYCRVDFPSVRQPPDIGPSDHIQPVITTWPRRYIKMPIATVAQDDGARQRVMDTQPDSQRMTFNFDFAMPIQDTFTLTRDPNRFPIVVQASNDPGTSPPDPPPPNRLTTAHVDVQNYIMTFLSTRDLSSLMRTCRYFLDACLLALCARSRDLHFDLHLTRLPSFRRFLRINAGPSSRAHLIKELCITAAGNCDDRYIYELSFVSIQEQWSAALLDILRHCGNLRRLRVHKWFLRDISFPLLVKTIGSSLPHLEDLTMPMPYDTDATVLRRLARVPLRSLSLLKYPTSYSLDHTYISLDVLPRSLMELEIHRCPRTDTPFPMVQKLGIRETLVWTFVADVTAAFPNVSHLVLRRYDIEFPRQVAYNLELLEDARTRNKTDWQSAQCRKAWPSVSAIWAEDASFAYALGFPRRVSSLSIPIGRLAQDDYIAPVLADARPSFLELRVDIEMFAYRQWDWERVIGPPSVTRLTLLVYARAVTDRRSVSYVLECLGAVLPALTSLTHLLVKFVPTPQQPGSALRGTEWVYSPRSPEKTNVVHGTIQACLRILADTAPSLQWIGYEVYGWGIKSWDVSRPSSSSSSDDAARRVKGPKMAEMSEPGSLAIVRGQGMDVFKDVEPTLVLM